MEQSRQELLKELQELKRVRDGKKRRMAYLEETNLAVKEYRSHQEDVERLQDHIVQVIHEIQYHCHHTFFETSCEYDKILDAKIRNVKCVACGFETLLYQMSDLEQNPPQEMIFKNNEAHFDFSEAKKCYGKLEKEYGEEKAGQMVLALSKEPK